MLWVGPQSKSRSFTTIEVENGPTEEHCVDLILILATSNFTVAICYDISDFESHIFLFTDFQNP